MNTQNEPTCKKIFSWRAALLGGLVAFGLLFLFNLLTVGGGLSTYVHTEQGLEKLVAFAYLWLAFGSFLMLFIAGMVTTMVVHYDRCMTGSHHSILHGFITWVFYILISLAFLSHLSEASIVTFPQNFFIVHAENSAMSSETELSMTQTAKKPSKNMTTEEKREAHKLGIATLAAFFVFGLEALGACFGAWCGMDICRRHCQPKSN